MFGGRTRARRLGLVLLGLVSGACERPVAPDAGVVTRLLERRPHVVTESRYLPFGSGSRRHLREGWHGNEWNPELGRHFVWAHGRRSTVELRLLQVLDLQVLLELSPATASGPSPIGVSVNGRKVATLEPVPGYREYRFLVPAEALRKGRNRLAFEHAVSGPPPRRLSASYSWILLGPECLRLRPKGRPPEPPRVLAEDGALDVRGPAEVTWKAALPREARLQIRAEVGEDPVRLVVDVRDEEGWGRAGEARLGAPWLGERALRSASFDLGAWSGRPVALRLGVLPEPCGSAYADARLVEVSVSGTAIDKASDLSR